MRRVRVEQTIPMVRVACPDCGWAYGDRRQYTEQVSAAKRAGIAHARANPGHRVEVEDPRVIVYEAERSTDV